jgi:N-acetylneuraminate synthase/N,N'-diacetyllegionaminate synthase
MRFGDKEFDLTAPGCLVIAEVGVNHDGDLGQARQLVDVAVAAGADVVKFQAFKSSKEISRFAAKTPYQQETVPDAAGQLELCANLELSESALQEMRAYCAQRGVGFLCTAFEQDSFDFIVSGLGERSVKIPSGEVTNIPFLEHVGQHSRSVVLSTGASTLWEVGVAVDALRKGGCTDLLLLHCVSSYPADSAEANLRCLATLRTAFGVPVGFSDHTLGIGAAVAAAALGAAAVEKHITLDRTLPGPDHRASLEPPELRAMVAAIRDAVRSIGRATKEPQSSELDNVTLIRKGLVAARDLAAGTRLTREMLEIKRPAVGIAPGDLAKVVGTVLTMDIVEDAPLTWAHLK